MKNASYILILILFVSCLKKSKINFNKLQKMSWLVGHWEQKLPDGLLIENWKKENDSIFSGDSYFVNIKDTIHFESIKLIQKNEELTYVANVLGQNNDKPINFKHITSKIDNVFSFENPSHDFPQKITYTKVNEKNLIATISGIQNGKIRQESYVMRKK